MSIIALFLLAYLAYLITDLTLSVINLNHLEKNKDRIPPYFSDYIDMETYRKSIEYTRARGRFGIISGVFSSIIIIAIVITGFLGTFDEFIKAFHLSSRLHGIVYLIGLSILISLLELPLSIYNTFVIEQRFGFNKTTPKTWFIDLIKGLILQILIMGPILWGLFWFIENAGIFWWMYAFCFIAVTQIFLLFLFPVIIAPIFNKFTPLPEGTLSEKIIRLSEKLKFKTSGIFVMDGSRRTSHANAYFTGFGSNKRIVLYDTLINTLSEDQVVSVLAHEIGHEKKKHVVKMMLISLVFMALGLWIISVLLNYSPLFHAFGFESTSSYAALIIFSIISTPVGFFVAPIFSALSRKHEYEADKFASEAVQASKDLAEALLALSKKSLSNLTPHPLYSFFHYSHPTLLERLKALDELQIMHNTKIS